MLLRIIVGLLQHNSVNRLSSRTKFSWYKFYVKICRSSVESSDGVLRVMRITENADLRR